LALPAQAEAGRSKATVPFAFTLGNETMPAGEYYVERMPRGFGLMIFSPVGPGRGFATTPLGNPNATSDPRLVFEKTGGVYRLAEVWLAGSFGGNRVPPLRGQATLVGRNSGRPENVVIALNR
jgi:hypothetical protein